MASGRSRWNSDNAPSTISPFNSLRELPKSNVFTAMLPPDPAFRTPLDSHSAPREALGPRLVKGALYTFVRPEPTLSPELLAVSTAAIRDLALAPGAAKEPEFVQALAGNDIVSWDEANPDEGVYPWAQCYGGFQFGQWAGQLGDGRAISLFETTNPRTGMRYEVQLKGAGRTPYSRFADGKAVLRSSVREFVVSEYLNAIGIPTTRALALVLAPRASVVRERIEPGAIVARFAPSWIRLGTFDLLHVRRDRVLLRRLADYVAEHVYGGWQKLLATAVDPIENRFACLYREIVRRNAVTVAAWQAYGFMNGVLNTDNTSILGLSIDYGPFAFMDNFDPSYTPNHDDHFLRYSYRNQPTVIWWNLVRLGEALAELIGAGQRCDNDDFVRRGATEDWVQELIECASHVVERAGHEYRDLFLVEYKRLMAARLGLKTQGQSDLDGLLYTWLDILETHQLDFNQCFRRLSHVRTADLNAVEQREHVATSFFHRDGVAGGEGAAQQHIATWLEGWRKRVLEDWDEGNDDARCAAMKQVNPNFVPKGWVLDELINRVEHKNERDVLNTVMGMTLNPFDEQWGLDEQDEQRFCADPPRHSRAMQCSCSS